MNEDTKEYDEMPADDLIEELRVHVREDTEPPLDLAMALAGYGYDVNALLTSLARRKL